MVNDDQIRKQQLDVLGILFEVNKDVDDEYKAQKLIYEALTKAKEENNMENFNITTYVKDMNKIKWKQSRAKKNEFVKLFTNEIESARELYDVTRSEVLFLYSLSSFLLWEENLLVDKEGIPLNQTRLAEALEINRKTVYRNIKSLESKKCLIRIWDYKDTYFIINPYLMMKGQEINKALPKLFDLIGYKYKAVK